MGKRTSVNPEGESAQDYRGVSRKVRVRGRASPNAETLRERSPECSESSVSSIYDLTPVMAVIVMVVVAVVFVVPVAFMQPPAFSFMVVVRMAPISAFKRWPFPASRNPVIVTALLAPVSFDPDEARARSFSAPLIADRRRAGPEIYGNLR